MKIGEFARLGSLSIRMLRHYDDIGLLKPWRVDALTGYREYSARQLHQLRHIQTLRDLGFTLEETRTLLHSDLSSQDFAALLHAKREELRQQIVGATARLARLDVRLLALGQEHDMPDFEVHLKPIPPLLVASVSDPALQVPNEMGGLDISAMYDRLYRIVPLAERLLPQINLWTDSTDGPPHAEVTQVLSRPIEEAEDVRVYTLPALPNVAALTYRGHYASEGMTDAFAALHGWVETSGHREIGPTRQVFLGPAEPGAIDRFEIELQVPVERT